MDYYYDNVAAYDSDEFYEPFCISHLDFHNCNDDDDKVYGEPACYLGDDTGGSFEMNIENNCLVLIGQNHKSDPTKSWREYYLVKIYYDNYDRQQIRFEMLFGRDHAKRISLSAENG